MDLVEPVYLCLPGLTPLDRPRQGSGGRVMRTGLAEKTQRPTGRGDKPGTECCCHTPPLDRGPAPGCSLALKQRASTGPAGSQKPEISISSCSCLSGELSLTCSPRVPSRGAAGSGEESCPAGGPSRTPGGALPRFPHSSRLLTPLCLLTTNRALNSTEPGPGRDEAFCCVIIVTANIC